MMLEESTFRRSYLLWGVGLGLGVAVFVGLSVLLLLRPEASPAPTPPPTPLLEVMPSPTGTASSVLSLPTPTASAPAASTPTASAPSPTPTAAARPVTYTVQAGDTLSGIAYEFDVPVEDLVAANDLEGEMIYVEQVLVIPVEPGLLAEVTPTPTTTDATPTPEVAAATAPMTATETITAAQPITLTGPAPLSGDLHAAYPRRLEGERFTLHYVPEHHAPDDVERVQETVTQALVHIEATLGVTLEVSFDVYVAGRLFAPPDRALRGRSFSTARRLFLLDDGTGSPAERQYLTTRLLTHLVAENTLGQPASSLLREGLAVYVGMTGEAAADFVSPAQACAGYHQVEMLPRVSQELVFAGPIRNPMNYHVAGSFVGYLIERLDLEAFADLYTTGDYEVIYGATLGELEAAWISELEDVNIPFNAQVWSATVTVVEDAYARLFTGYDGTPAEVAAYRALDAARVALLEGRLADVDEHLADVQEALAAEGE
jgi:LysM repeat protein